MCAGENQKKKSTESGNGKSAPFDHHFLLALSRGREWENGIILNS